jgi:flagellar biosynthesis protein FlhG
LRLVDYFLAGGDGVLVLHPEPTSIENAYNFLRSVLLRRMELSMLKPEVQACVREAMDQRNDRGIRTPRDLLRAVRALDSEEARRFEYVLTSLRPRIVVNEVMTAEDVKLGFAVRGVCRSFFGVQADYLGYMNSDQRVRKALRAGVPVVESDPDAEVSVYLSRIARKLMRDAGLGA